MNLSEIRKQQRDEVTLDEYIPESAPDWAKARIHEVRSARKAGTPVPEMRFMPEHFRRFAKKPPVKPIVDPPAPAVELVDADREARMQRAILLARL